MVVTSIGAPFKSNDPPVPATVNGAVAPLPRAANSIPASEANVKVGVAPTVIVDVASEPVAFATMVCPEASVNAAERPATLNPAPLASVIDGELAMLPVPLSAKVPALTVVALA